eukprot:33002-Eustigmatos_ZCMA.PRE.1
MSSICRFSYVAPTILRRDLWHPVMYWVRHHHVLQEDWEDRERVLNPHALDELDFFMEWNLADITYAQRRWEEHERKEKQARSAALSPKRRGTASSDKSAA